MIIATLLALTALAVAIAGWFKPTQTDTPTAPQYSEQQIADANRNVCAAYDLGFRASSRAGTSSSEDPNQKYMIAINTRLAFNTAADYLTNELSQNPTAAPNVVHAVRNLVRTYHRIILAQIAEVQNDQLQLLYQDIDRDDIAVKNACK